MSQLPIGIKCIQYYSERFNIGRSINRDAWYRSSILILTFLSYTCYHASRKPFSVVKTYFSRNCSDQSTLHSPVGTNHSDKHWCDWAPFDTDDASTLLGTLDSAFLFAYAFAMFFSGYIAERISLRYFLALGMISSGIADYLLGITRNYGIHALWYYVLVQVFGGIVQTTGWPGVVTVMGNWFGKGKRGLIFGIWNSHTSVGNILGTILASTFIDSDWGLSFIVPGAVIAAMGYINFLFLVEHPADVDCTVPDAEEAPSEEPPEPSTSAPEPPEPEDSDTALLIPKEPVKKRVRFDDSCYFADEEEQAIDICGALSIPGVVEFSLCLFFAKLVSYTFLYWLPYYINTSTHNSAQFSAILSTIFDVGGILGGILAGAVSDYTGKSATTCAVMLVVSIPLLFFYYVDGEINIVTNAVMLTLVGFFVNGPYALITTAVAAELGTHQSLAENAKALATVTAIIDGTGSIGAAVGPLLAGVMFNWGWDYVFYMLMASDVLALIMLTRLVSKEVKPEHSPRYVRAADLPTMDQTV